MENFGAMADSRYTGFCEITDRDVLDLHCTYIAPDKAPFFSKIWYFLCFSLKTYVV